MAKARIGHFAEAQILQALGVDMIDESEGEKHILSATIFWVQVQLSDRIEKI